MNGLKKHSKILIIAGCAILTVLLAIPLKNIKIESSIRQFFPQKHESYQRLNTTEDEFGSMLAIGVSLETPGETILTTEYVETIRKITLDLEKVENTSDVTSIVNIDYIEGDEGAINVAPLLDKDSDEPITEDDISMLETRLAAWEEMYDLVVINKDRTSTQISLSVNHKSDLDEQSKALSEVKRIVEEDTKDSDLSVKFYGDPVISRDAKSFLLSDLVVLIPLVVLVVAISLFFSFSTFDGTILVLLSVLMSTIWSVGIMSLSGIEFSLVSSVIPVALIGCGSAYGIHVLTHYYVEVYKKREELDASGEKMTNQINQDCIKSGLNGVKKAVVLSAITTIAGFISLVTSPIRPLFGFAIFTALGIFFSLVLSVTFIPAVLSLKKLDKVGVKSDTVKILSARLRKRVAKLSRREENTKHDAAATMYSMYNFFCGSKPRMVIFALAIVGFSTWGILHLIIDTSMVNYFPKTARLRQDIDYVNENFAGTNSVYLLIKSPAAKVKEEANSLYAEAQRIQDSFGENEIDEASQKKIDELLALANEKSQEYAALPNMTNPEVLKAVDNMENWIESKFDIVGKAVSYTDSIKRINQTWNAPGAGNTATEADSSDMVDFGSDFGDFDSDFGDFGSDFGDFGDFGDSGASEISTAPEESEMTFEDPNKAYQEKLDMMMSGKEVQDLVNRAYSKAGGKNASVEVFVKALQKEMNYNGIAFYEIPYEPHKYQKAKREELAGLISNYTMMLGDSMERFTDDQTNYTPSTIRMQVQIKTNSTQVVGKMLKEFEKYASTHLPEGYYMEATGTGEMEYVMTNLVVSSQLTSLLFSLILVFVIIGLSFRSPIAGLIGCIPLAFCIILNYMVMGFVGIHLDLITSIIASVAIGVGIDYTIHFMTEYKSLRMESDDLEYCTRETFRTSGMGIITNAIAVGLGFLVLCFSKFVVLRYIGILIALVMFTSAVLAMTVIPGIFNAFDPKFLHPGKPKSKEVDD